MKRQPLSYRQLTGAVLLLALFTLSACASMPVSPGESVTYTKLKGVWNADPDQSGGWALAKIEFSDDFKVTYTDKLKDGNTKVTWFTLNKISDGKLWMTTDGASTNDVKIGEQTHGYIFRFINENSIRFGWDPNYYVTLNRE